MAACKWQLCLVWLAVVAGSVVAVDLCYDVTVDGDVAVTPPRDNKITVLGDVAEDAEPNKILMTMSWDPSSFEEIIVSKTSEFLPCPSSSTTPGILEVSVGGGGLETLADCGTRETPLVCTYEFMSASSETCTVDIKYDIQDSNTATPVASPEIYATTLGEDFPLNYAIPGVEITASDADYSVDNKKLNVISATPTCPLAAERSEYPLKENCLDGSGNMQPQTATIGLVLTDYLDFDAMPDPKLSCEITLTDGELESTFTVDIDVTGYNDEFPVFENPIYYISVTELEAPSAPLVVEPKDIHATDKDKLSGGAEDTLTYFMEVNVGEDAYWNEVFKIDSSSGEVNQVLDINNDYLTKTDVVFVVTVEDTASHTDITVLSVNLPASVTISAPTME